MEQLENINKLPHPSIVEATRLSTFRRKKPAELTARLSFSLPTNRLEAVSKSNDYLPIKSRIIIGAG